MNDVRSLEGVNTADPDAAPIILNNNINTFEAPSRSKFATSTSSSFPAPPSSQPSFNSAPPAAVEDNNPWGDEDNTSGKYYSMNVSRTSLLYRCVYHLQ